MSELAQLITELAGKQTGKDLMASKNATAIQKMAERWIEEGRGHLNVEVSYPNSGTAFEKVEIKVTLLCRTHHLIFEANYYLAQPLKIEDIEEKFKDKLKEMLA